jgi:hypothetical protein
VQPVADVCRSRSAAWGTSVTRTAGFSTASMSAAATARRARSCSAALVSATRTVHSGHFTTHRGCSRSGIMQFKTVRALKQALLFNNTTITDGMVAAGRFPCAGAACPSPAVPCSACLPQLGGGL